MNIKNIPIRVLHVLTAMNRAGTETMLMNLYRNIDKQTIQFDFAVTTIDHCDYDDEIESLGGKIYHYPRYKGTNHLFYKKWWKSFFKKHQEYSIVHGHIGSTAAIYLSIAKQAGLYTIAHSHSTGGKITFRNLLYKLYSYRTRYIADYFIGCSTEALISRYGKRIAEKKEISTVLNNGIDVYQYRYNQIIRDQVRKEFSFSEKDFVVGTVGRITDAKNPYFIVDILSELRKKDPAFRFLWAGTGELEEEIKGYIIKKELSENVFLLGVRNDIPRLLQILNVFILPSKYEGLPVIGVETQAAGVPMLCSNQVSHELKMSDCVTFLPINVATSWVNEILKERNFRRIDNASISVINAGYDIHKTVQRLSEIYSRAIYYR